MNKVTVSIHVHGHLHHRSVSKFQASNTKKKKKSNTSVNRCWVKSNTRPCIIHELMKLRVESTSM